MKINDHIEIDVDAEKHILWLKIGVPADLHYSYATICHFYDSLNFLRNEIARGQIRHVVLLSPNRKVWNMGGDLEMFVHCVKNNDAGLLKDYAYKCIAGVHAISESFASNAIVTCVLQGNAFGGGFECALSGNYIIAERQVNFSFPEVLFGTFPGMGAYSFLTRKLGFMKAKQMIDSGGKWSASQLQEMGLVTRICNTGSGIDTVLSMIGNEELAKPDHFSKACHAVPLSELQRVVDLWLDGVMALGNSRIDFMMKLVDAQKNKMSVA